MTFARHVAARVSKLALAGILVGCAGVTFSATNDVEFPGINPPLYYNQPFPSNHAYATTPPKTNKPADLPAFKYVKGAATNLLVLQSKVSERQGWVTIAGPFYGTNGFASYTYTVSNQCVPEINYRMAKP